MMKVFFIYLRVSLTDTIQRSSRTSLTTQTLLDIGRSWWSFHVRNVTWAFLQTFIYFFIQNRDNYTVINLYSCKFSRLINLLCRWSLNAYNVIKCKQIHVNDIPDLRIYGWRNLLTCVLVCTVQDSTSVECVMIVSLNPGPAAVAGPALPPPPPLHRREPRLTN